MALQTLYVVGVWNNDEVAEFRQVQFTSDEACNSIVAGKDFMLLVSTTGKVSHTRLESKTNEVLKEIINELIC